MTHSDANAIIILLAFILVMILIVGSILDNKLEKIINEIRIVLEKKYI